VSGPLEGVKVLDFTWALAGPYGVMVLADLGAEVWKIETVGQNEKRRGMGRYVHDVSTYFFSVNRGKKSVMLDLKAPEAQEIIYKLVPQVDVVTENFSPGAMDRLGSATRRFRSSTPDSSTLPHPASATPDHTAHAARWTRSFRAWAES